MSHISWLLPTVHALLPRDLMIHRMVQLAKKWVGERVERGSRFKDFFYHLVSKIFSSNFTHFVHAFI